MTIAQSCPGPVCGLVNESLAKQYEIYKLEKQARLLGFEITAAELFSELTRQMEVIDQRKQLRQSCLRRWKDRPLAQLFALRASSREANLMGVRNLAYWMCKRLEHLATQLLDNNTLPFEQRAVTIERDRISISWRTYPLDSAFLRILSGLLKDELPLGHDWTPLVLCGTHQVLSKACTVTLRHVKAAMYRRMGIYSHWILADATIHQLGSVSVISGNHASTPAWKALRHAQRRQDYCEFRNRVDRYWKSLSKSVWMRQEKEPIINLIRHACLPYEAGLQMFLSRLDLFPNSLAEAIRKCFFDLWTDLEDLPVYDLNTPSVDRWLVMQAALETADPSFVRMAWSLISRKFDGFRS